MTAGSARLARWQARLIYWSGAALWISGGAWLLLHHFWQRQGEFGPETNPIEPWALRLHGAAVIAALLAIGSLLVAHVRRGWAYRAQRVAGLALAIAVGAMTVTGYLLYYASDDWGRPAASIVHWAIGLVGLPLLLWHWANARRLRRPPAARAGGAATPASRQR